MNVFKWFFVFMAVTARAAYDPYVDCALAQIRVHVVDDLGDSVGNAEVAAVFYVGATKTKVVRKATDRNGRFEATNLCNGELHLLITKDGYYDTYYEPKFVTASKQDIQETRKWSDGPVVIRSVLKKRRNPARLVLKGGPFQELKYPATNVVMGLDLQKFDWCPPYGKGEYDDVQIRYDFWRSPTNWFQVYSHLDLTMTNCFDGVYLSRTEDFSTMNRCYSANTNAVYLKALEFVYDRRTGTVARDIEMPRDRYMVFRTRTRVDDKGEIVSANYGLIFEKSECGTRLNMRTAFNPAPNDPNLECEGGWR